VVQEARLRRPKTDRSVVVGPAAFLSGATTRLTIAGDVHRHVMWVFNPSKIAAFLDSRSRDATVLGIRSSCAQPGKSRAVFHQPVSPKGL